MSKGKSSQANASSRALTEKIQKGMFQRAKNITEDTPQSLSNKRKCTGEKDRRGKKTLHIAVQHSQAENVQEKTLQKKERKKSSPKSDIKSI